MSSLDATLALSFDHSAVATPDWSVASCPAAVASSLSRSRYLPTFIFSYPSVRGFLHACIFPLYTCNGLTPCTGGLLSLQLKFQDV